MYNSEKKKLLDVNFNVGGIAKICDYKGKNVGI